jgi:hypothetical protein
LRRAEADEDGERGRKRFMAAAAARTAAEIVRKEVWGPAGGPLKTWK